MLMFATAHAATLSDSERAALLDWRAGPQQLQSAKQLAASLGHDRRLEAVDTLLEGRSYVLMDSFVSSVLAANPAPAVTPALETRAIELARAESYDRDSDSRMTRDAYFRLLRGYHSSELFNVFLEYAREELDARRIAGPQNLMSRPRWYGVGMLTMAQVPDMEAPLASLLPLISTACNGLQLIGYFGTHPYPPALPSLEDLYLRSSIDRTNYCTDQLRNQLVAAQTRSATEAMAERIRWLADQPDDAARDTELKRTIYALGPIRATAQIDYDELEQQLAGKPMTAAMRNQVETAFDQAKRTAKRAREFTLENLDFWIADGNAALVADFLDHGVRPVGKDARGQTRFGLAIAGSQFPMALNILQAGGDVTPDDLVTLCKLPAGVFSSRKVDTEGLLSTLVEHGLDVNRPDSQGWAPLHRAASAGNVPMMAALVSHHAGLEIQLAATPGLHEDPLVAMTGATPLHIAARDRQLGAAEFLLGHGANVNAETARHATPLLFAAAFGNPVAPEATMKNLPVATLLIDHGAKVNLAADDGVTPVLIAHENGNAEMEALLTSRGAKINVVTLLRRKLVHSVEEAYASGMK